MKPTIEFLKSRCHFPQPEGCWIWQGSLAKGYGQVTVRRRGLGRTKKKKAIRKKVHRLMMQLHGYRVTREHEVHHKCYFRACCNPEHLEVLTKAKHRKVTARDRKEH